MLLYPSRQKEELYIGRNSSSSISSLGEFSVLAGSLFLVLLATHATRQQYHWAKGKPTLRTVVSRLLPLATVYLLTVDRGRRKVKSVDFFLTSYKG